MFPRLSLILLFLAVICKCSEEDQSCSKDDDCKIYMVCSDSECVRKELFPMADAEIGGTFLLILMAIISISGGIGGSAICSALLLSLYRFLPHQAVALTQSFLFSGTLTAICIKIRDRHPTRDRPIIYYDFLLQISCPLVLGVSIGVLLNPAFPGWLILALLTLVIIIVICLTLRNGIIIFKQEQEMRRKINHELRVTQGETGDKNEENDEKNEENDDKNDKVESEGDQEYESDNARPSDGEKNSESNNQEIKENNSESSERSVEGIAEESQGMKNNIEKRKTLSDEEYARYEKLPEELRRSITAIREDEKKPISFIHILFFLLMTGFGICFTIFRGTQNMKSQVGIGKCSGGFYGLLFTYIVIMLGLSCAISFYLIKKHNICNASGYDFEKGDIRWTYSSCLFFIGMGVLIGVLVGIIGFGGFIVSPILLHLKIDPEITTLSSLFTIMLTSCSALIQFYIAGITNWKYSLYLICCAHIGSLIAILVVRKYFLKIRRKSFLVFALVFIFTASLFIIPTFGIINLVNQREDGTFQLGFKPIC
jgi:uncharacterized membrane protein YfcA